MAINVYWLVKVNIHNTQMSSNLLSQSRKMALHHLSSLSAKLQRNDQLVVYIYWPGLSYLSRIVLFLVDGLWRIRIQVEGIPCRVEFIIRVGDFVGLDGFVQTIFADVAPGFFPSLLVVLLVLRITTHH